MNWVYTLHSLLFNNYGIFYQQVDTVPAVNLYSPICNRQSLLPLNSQTLLQ